MTSTLELFDEWWDDHYVESLLDDNGDALPNLSREQTLRIEQHDAALKKLVASCDRRPRERLVKAFFAYFGPKSGPEPEARKKLLKIRNQCAARQRRADRKFLGL